MNEYPFGSVEDREMLAEMPIKNLLDFFFLQIRNLWRVDGLYFLGIEKEFGTEAATEIDAGAWQIMAQIEARSLRRMFQVDENADIQTTMNLLSKSSWALDQPFKAVKVTNKKAVLSIGRCRTQETRLKRGLGEFPCKKVRFSYLKNFAKTLNPNIDVKCLVCPPDKHPTNLWCKWEFKL
jgi:hypothetical protein